MRRITHLVVHCTAGPQNQSTADIRHYWRKALGWKNPGYHVIINADGSWERLAPDSQVCNGVAGHNSTSLHVCYKGGKYIDDRTPAQKEALILALQNWKRQYPNAVIQGHRDFPGVIKACPRFDARNEYRSL
jgi:N-acetylmuramoyl-L-alanine amidase